MIEIGNRPAVVLETSPFHVGAITSTLSIAQELRKLDIVVVWLAHGTALDIVKAGHIIDYVLPFDLREAEHRRKYARYIEDADAVFVNSDREFARFTLELGKELIYVDQITSDEYEMSELAAHLDVCVPKNGMDSIVKEIIRRVEARTSQPVRPSQRESFEGVPLPRKLTLEVFGGCQLRCPLCPTGNRLKPGRAKGALKIRTVEALLREIGNHVEVIELFNWGEPFLNPDICTIIRMIADQGIRTVLSSNLQRIPEPREIISSGLSELIVSCHGITQPTYERYMIGGDVRLTLQNIDRILAEGGSEMKMIVVLRFVVFAHNAHELSLAEERFRGTPVIVEAAPMRMDMRDEVLGTQEQNLTKYGEWVPESSRFYDKQRLEATRSPLGCNLPFEETVIDVDGSVSMCCSSFDPKYNVGNFLENGFSAVWNGENYQEARRVVTGRGETGSENVICRTCKNNSYRDF